MSVYGQKPPVPRLAVRNVPKEERKAIACKVANKIIETEARRLRFWRGKSALRRDQRASEVNCSPTAMMYP
jgi:hypothetical protein